MSDHNMRTAGIDTGKHTLAVCLLPGEVGFEVPNTAAGHAELAARCKSHGIARAGIEATSVYHKAAATALRAEGLEVCELQPAQARAFAKALLRRAKNDRIDAQVLARMAQVMTDIQPAPDARLEALAEHLTFIDQIDDAMTVLKTSKDRFTTPRLRARIDEELKRLRAQKRTELAHLQSALKAHDGLARRFELLRSVPAIGEACALALTIRMPELGSLSREQAASLAGLAPMDDDSGTRKGARRIQGGRARVRKSLFMAAFAGIFKWSQDLRAFYKRLMARGKHHTAAVIACARKLLTFANTVLTRMTPWEDRPGMPCP